MRQRNLEIPDVAIRDLCERYQIKELSIFGSVVGSDFRAESDIDILIEFEPEAPRGLFNLVRIQRELEDIFGRNIDLVPKGGLKSLIRDEVLASAEVIYAS